MNWNDFYKVVMDGKEGKWLIQKQPDGTVYLFDTTRSFTWMMDKNSEINAYNSIKVNAKGKVLMGGLGIGYEAFFLKELPEVNEIIIIEREKEIIDLTTRYLKHSKIKVINDHVLSFMNKTNETFDLVYFDIFFNPGKSKKSILLF